MTSLVAWVGIDSRGPASVYIATDSRLSKGKANWDCGRKVFACDRSASIFGYCGAVLFPSQLLGQLTQAIDSGMLFSESTRPQEKLDVIANKLSMEAERFPEQAEFTIVYATRVGEGLGATFFVATISWSPIKKMLVRTIPIPVKSGLLYADGSGKRVVESFGYNWKKSDVGRTSRAVFSAFCDSVASGADPLTGGSPQLVGIYVRGAARVFGFYDQGHCYLNGMRTSVTQRITVECRNRLFERCEADGRIIGQKHARPPNLPP